VAGVSRAWLYRNPGIRDLISRLRCEHTPRKAAPRPAARQRRLAPRRPDGDRCAAAAACSACRSRPVRNAASPRAGAPWWKNTVQLRLGGVLGPKIVIALQQRPAFQDA
jgi:hypothetical protein